jgi:beta-mannosidase
MKEVYSNKCDVVVDADGSQKILSAIDIPKNITNVYFLKLELKDASGKMVSSNFYWLSSKGDDKADFTDLSKLPAANVNVTASAIKQSGNKCTLTVTIENKGTSLAFAVNPKILKLTSKEPVLPVFWEDNYFSLLPKEKRVLQVEYDLKDLDGEKPLLKVDGWNVKALEKDLK